MHWITFRYGDQTLIQFDKVVRNNLHIVVKSESGRIIEKIPVQENTHLIDTKNKSKSYVIELQDDKHKVLAKKKV